jgi:hypothetical protein
MPNRREDARAPRSRSLLGFPTLGDAVAALGMREVVAALVDGFEGFDGPAAPAAPAAWAPEGGARGLPRGGPPGGRAGAAQALDGSRAPRLRPGA